MAPADLAGTWKLKESVNFDKYLKEQGVGAMGVIFGTRMVPVQEIYQDDDNISIKISYPLEKQEMNFTVGQSFRMTMAGLKADYNCMPSWDERTLVTNCKPLDPSRKPYKEIRKISDDKLIQRLEINGVTCIRTFCKVEDQ